MFQDGGLPAVAGAHDDDFAGPVDDVADALGDVQRLTHRVGVPVGRAPGVKCTRPATSRDGGAGILTGVRFISRPILELPWCASMTRATLQITSGAWAGSAPYDRLDSRRQPRWFDRPHAERGCVRSAV